MGVDMKQQSGKIENTVKFYKGIDVFPVPK